MTSKYATDPAFLEQVQRIKDGQATRAEAAEALGITAAVFNVRLARTGLNSQIKHRRNYSGAHLFQANPDNAQAYAEATKLALAAGSVVAAHRVYQHLDYSLIARRVRKAKAEAKAAVTAAN